MHQANSPMLLEALPRELLPRIFLNLDSFSLRALFQAYPGVTRHCVLILQEEPPRVYPYPHKAPAGPPALTSGFFEDCKNLRRILCNQYDPRIHKSFFRIYEAHNVGISWLHKISLDPKERFPYIDKRNSFIHYFSCSIGGGNPHGHCKHELAQEHILSAALRKEGIVFECSADLERGMVPYSSQISFEMDKAASHCRFDALQSLRLEGIEKIESLTLPPNLSYLTLVFKKACKSPVIRDLRYTARKRCRALAIYYHDRVPLMEDITMAVGAVTDCPPPFANFLVLTHIPSMRGNLTQALPPHPDEGRDFSYVGNTFKGQLSSLTITGGPNGIAESFDLSAQDALASLILKQTCQYRSPNEQALISLQKVKHLTTVKFETLLERAVFPALVYRDCVCMLTMLCITAHRGLDLRHLAGGLDRLHCFKYLYIDVQSNENDYVSSIREISPLVDQLDGILGVGIVGLRGKGSAYAVDLEPRLKERLEIGLYPYHGISEISLKD